MSDKTEREWCLKKAIWYAGRYLCSEKRLIEYLHKKGCSKYADEILEKLKELKAVDDGYAARYYAEIYSKKYGPQAIKEKLYKKGFKKELINEILTNFDEKVEINAAKNLAEEKFKRLPTDMPDKKKAEKIYRYLVNKGFSHRVSYDVVKKLFSKETEEFY